MTLAITCKHCRIDIEGDDEDQLVERVQAHVRTHDQPIEVTREQVLARLHRQHPDAH
jgi:hypothetical protein